MDGGNWRKRKLICDGGEEGKCAAGNLVSLNNGEGRYEDKKILCAGHDEQQKKKGACDRPGVRGVAE